MGLGDDAVADLLEDDFVDGGCADHFRFLIFECKDNKEFEEVKGQKAPRVGGASG